MSRTAHNTEEIVKSLIDTGTITSNGTVQVQEADRFLDYVENESVMLSGGNTRVERISKGDRWRVNKIGVGQRNAVPAEEGVDPGFRRGVSTSSVPLTTSEIMLSYDITQDFKETNLEGDSVSNHIAQMFAKAMANDMEDMILNGNTLGPAILSDDYANDGNTTQYRKDGLLALQDGFFTLFDAGAQVLDAGGENFGVRVLRQAMTTLPAKYRKNRNSMGLYLNLDLLEMWQEKLSRRGTPIGDAALSDGKTQPYNRPFGLPPVPLSLFEFNPTVVKHVTLSGTTATSLGFANIKSGSVVVTTSSLTPGTPETPYTLTTDYTLDLAAGTIARNGAGSIGDGDVVKVTFQTPPQMLLTPKNNLIVGFSRDMQIESDRDIHRRVDEVVMTTKIGFAVENLEACVLIKNLGEDI